MRSAQNIFKQRVLTSSAWGSLFIPMLAIFTALLVGGLLIWLTSGSIETVFLAYGGLLRGALFKVRGLSESFVAAIPYIFLGLAIAVGFKSGLFNIGVEGQFYMGAVAAAWIGSVTTQLPAIIHLPVTLLAAVLAGALWAAIPGYLKAKTGAHEVITTIMLNYVSFRFTEFIVSGPLRDPQSSAVQTSPVSSSAELWSLYTIPARLQDPLNALGVSLVVAITVFFIARYLRRRRELTIQTAPLVLSVGRAHAVRSPGFIQRHSSFMSALVAGALAFVILPVITNIWWPFSDTYDRLHIGLFLAVAAVFIIAWLLFKTTIGFELRTAGANANAARYAGVHITRNIVLAMAISGGLAGLAGMAEVLGVSTCRCLPMFFSSGYGFDSIAISLLANNSPFGILGVGFLFGAMRNGADLMELSSGVSKYIISLIQAMILLFVSAPAIVRWIYRIKADQKEVPAIATGEGGDA